MKVIILCGGKGTRLREETEFKPKPMVEIGGTSGAVAYHVHVRPVRPQGFCCCPSAYKGEVHQAVFPRLPYA